MPEVLKPENNQSRTPSPEQEDNKDKEENEICLSRENELQKGDRKEEELQNSVDDPEVFQDKTGERIKSMKSDLRLLIVRENVKKLNEVCDKEEEEVDKIGKRGSDDETEDSVPPALPPRPPPRPRQPCTCTCGLDDVNNQENIERGVPRSCWASGLRKYVFLCTGCGSLSVLLGALFLIVYFILKSYTSSLNHFETIPTYVPSGMLIATGFLIICLACRKNRNSFLMKLCGLCSICCAVLCVSVTVTTTVIHMNRLQTLRECLYTQKTQSCTCYSVLLDNDRIGDEGIKFVFNSTPDCEVIHGALYSCLRAIFGLSVIGILVCIASCMVVYQLLGHEKKKMYWAQLEMRCRYLYRQQRNPHYYSCCDECRYPPHPHELFPWELMGNRFWSTGRIGNLYTPNPEDRGNHNRLRTGWNWRRLPWSRSGGNSNEPTRANLSSPDSQYGFSSTPTVDGAPYTVLDPRTTSGIPPCHTGIPTTADITEGGFYSWGPPPPYASNRNSANNSPARRSLGDILHQVSPIRRNDNVSPARAMHHVHRHHMHHTRQCGSSSRQVTNTHNQSDSLQKSTPTHNTPITNAIQQQQAGMNPLWSNSLSSVHRFQKVIQNKDNYENLYDSENLPPTSGFNTLPSLKKRNQTRVGDIFQNETSTAYFFSSAENLGCSTSNIDMESQSENLPPRLFLTNGTPNTPRYGGNTPQNYGAKDQNDLEMSGSSNQQQQTIENKPTVPGPRSLRPIERNTSLVKKLFVNCSPTKQKPRSAQETQVYSVEKKENLMQTPRKKISKKLGLPKEGGIETSNENVITFHYRVGIPRSPNIQNFSQFIDKPPGSFSNNQEETESDLWSNDKPCEPLAENHKIPKGIKYMSKDADILQKHNSLIKEINKNIDLQKNIKFKNNKTENRKNNGIENEGFQQVEDSSREVKHFPKNYQSVGHSHGAQERSKVSCSVNETETNEDYLLGNTKPNENESDVYFGDISNSSCYMSVQNDGPESLLYEETVGDRSNAPRFSSNGHPFLNKQNLKMIEDESLSYTEVRLGYDTHADNKHEESSTYSRHGDPFQNYRYRRIANQYRCIPEKNQEENSDDFNSRSLKPESKSHDGFGKNQKQRLCIPSSHFAEVDKPKYFNSVSSRGLQDHYRPSDSLNSNDEQSSSSLTADSGISSGRSFMPKCFETYHEIECRPKGNEPNANVRSDQGLDSLNEKYSPYGNKIPNLDSLGDFSHPLFQKPKVLPRGSRYKESESRQRKKVELEESESGNDLDSDTQSKRKRNFGNSKIKILEANEEVSNQLLSTCNLTLKNDSDHFLGEDKFESMSKNQEDMISAQKEETLRKSPKPLPRTSVLNKNPLESMAGDHSFGKSRYAAQNKDKLSHFLAPDAQYDLQENFKGDSMSKAMKHSNQNLGRNKPAVPARPLNLQVDHKKSGKMEALRAESGYPIPRRRQNETEDKVDIEIGTHSVNV